MIIGFVVLGHYKTLDEKESGSTDVTLKQTIIHKVKITSTKQNDYIKVKIHIYYSKSI
jgi:hypothetical protein